MTSCRTSFVAFAFLVASAAALHAQDARPVPALTAQARAAVIDSAAASLERLYVEADTGRMIADLLRRKLRAGGYDSLATPPQLAGAVTRDLQSLNGDLHLSLGWSPAAGPAPGLSTPAAALPASRINFGLGRAEILDGNVGYLEITAFAGAPGYRDAVADALRFLSRTDAVIIDVRRNGGGSGEMSHYVFSHFLGATPVPTIRVKRRSGDPFVRESFAEVAGPRRPDVPLFVLTSQNTGSAAEEFSFVLRNLRRATIVGTRTAGAGHMVNFVPVGEGFRLGVSITRVSDPATGLEWEGTGVQPHMAVPAAEALAEAHAAALRAILATNPDASRARLVSRLLEVAEARRRPDRPDGRLLAGFAGTYEGGRTVSVANGALTYARRAGGVTDTLVWLGGNRFASGTTLFTFEDQGGSVRLQVELPDGSVVTFARASSRD